MPEHLIVLAGGYVGLEFAQAYRRFGSRVTIIERGPQLLGREDSTAACCDTASPIAWLTSACTGWMPPAA